MLTKLNSIRVDKLLQSHVMTLQQFGRFVVPLQHLIAPALNAMPNRVMGWVFLDWRQPLQSLQKTQ